jgi:membrane protein involved in colicin uptake
MFSYYYIVMYIIKKYILVKKRSYKGKICLVKIENLGRSSNNASMKHISDEDQTCDIKNI